MNGEKIIRLLTSRDQRLDDLAARLGDMMDGERDDDVMLVISSLLGFLIRQGPPHRMEKRMTAIFKFIKDVAEDNFP